MTSTRLARVDADADADADARRETREGAHRVVSRRSVDV
jgi:hypothetical protein